MLSVPFARRLLFSLVSAHLLPVFGVFAAPAPADADQPPTASAAPAAVAIAARDIPGQADEDERLAREIAAHAADRTAGDALRIRLDQITKSVLQLASQLRGRDLTNLPSARLEGLERRWLFYQRELESWRRDQQRVIDQYADEASQLETRREAWQATLAPDDRDVKAVALLARAREVRKALAVAEKALAEPMTAQLSLGRRANSIENSIASGLKAVRAAMADWSLKLLRADAPPLWNAGRDFDVAPSAFKAATAGIGVDRQFLREYFAANRDRLRGHVIFAVLLLPALLWLSARSKRLLAADQDLAGSGQALTRPISSWIVLVLLGALIFESDGPLLLQEIALLLAVVPVLRLLPVYLFQVLGPWPYAATGLYVLHRMGFALVGDPLWHRVHLLIVTLLTLGVLVWLVLKRPVEAQTGVLGRAQRISRNVGFVAIALLCIAAVANVVGNVTLAEVLTAGTLDSGYIGLALLAGVGVLNAIVHLLLIRREDSRLGAVTKRAGPVIQAVAKVINVAAVVVWVLAILNSFSLLRPVVGTVYSVLTYPVGIGKVTLTLGSLLLFGFGVYVAFWIARWMRVILNDEVLPKMALPRGVANSVSTLSYYAIVLVGLLFALAAAGFQMSQFAIVFGALGVGIGFGLQNVVNNFVSGLILMFERPIQPGDTVEITGTTGTVRDIGMRATTLKTGEGADVVIPNGTLLSEKLINWTMSDMSRRVDVDIGVAYGSNPREVADLLAEVTRTTPGISERPPPVVILNGFGASSLNFGIRASANFSDWVAIRTELALRVHDALTAAGIEIPVPQQDVRIRSIDAAARAELAPSRTAPDANRAGPDPALPPISRS